MNKPRIKLSVSRVNHGDGYVFAYVQNCWNVLDWHGERSGIIIGLVQRHLGDEDESKQDN